MEPLVTVICLTYNHANYVRNALDGILMQRTNFPFEIVVHDDASIDGTQDIIREYEEKYPGIFNVVYQKENQYSKTKSFVYIDRNIITPRIRGKYVAACEGDDYWLDPDKLQMQVDYMEAHPNCSCTFHPIVWLDESQNGKVVRTTQMSASEQDFTADELIGPTPVEVPTCSRVVRADIVKEWPKFRRIADIGDLPGQLLLASHGYFHCFPNVMGVYRWNHPESWNRKFQDSREFAIRNAITGLRWTYEFHLYCNGKYDVYIGKLMLFQIVVRLDRVDAINEFPWLQEIVIQANEKKGKMLELEQTAKKLKNNKKIQEKFKAAEKEYYSWFVKAIGEGIPKNERGADV